MGHVPLAFSWLPHRARIGICLRGSDRIRDLRNLCGNLVDFGPLFLDDVLFNLANIRVDLLIIYPLLTIATLAAVWIGFRKGSP